MLPNQPISRNQIKCDDIINTGATEVNFRIGSTDGDNTKDFSKDRRYLESTSIKLATSLDVSVSQAFKSLSVYPSREEIVSSENAFVNTHKVEESYESVAHYLEIQFRSLKEDFVAPLRKIVCTYLNPENQKNSQLCSDQIHTDVQFVSLQCSGNEIGVLLKFPIKKDFPKSIAHSMRFNVGSVVCFTKDNFKTCLFGRIIGRDVHLLNEGKIIVGFETENNDYELNIPYIMIETNICFERYFYVLKALQRMLEDNFPMKNYLIDVIPKVELPDYINERSSLKIGDKTICLNAKSSWPTAKELQLDHTQYSAYKAALTQKFALIQAPPATGKIYLGLKIVKTLLENKSNWYQGSPILIICHTNHALDQFLEGLITVTDKIVRVGGQSRNEKLQPFHLNNIRKGRTDLGVTSEIFALKTELQNLMQQINLLCVIRTEIEKFESILDFQQFKNIDGKFCNSWFDKASQDEILSWLCDDFITESQSEYNYNTLKDEVEVKRYNVAEAENLDSKDTGVEDTETINSLLNNNEFTLNIEDDFCIDIDLHENEILISKDILHKNIKQCIINLEKLDYLSDRTDIMGFEILLYYLNKRLSKGKNMERQQLPTTMDYDNPEEMPLSDRWVLYFYWLSLYKRFIINELLRLQYEHHEIYQNYLEIRNIEDTKLMKGLLVVGITSIAAARLQPILQALKCRIVIVEEAARVLEPHITICLTSHCQHLILIGDHKQLRPSTEHYNREIDFSVNIGMFERMVLNNMPCYVLGLQNRMRPEIAELLIPIYPKLINDKSVYQFSKVLGVDPCLFFLHHQSRKSIPRTSSTSNLHEAKFLIRFANYLIQNGYQPKDLAILTLCTDQTFTLLNERNAYCLLKDVRISTTDNYQGEESKIILLSLGLSCSQHVSLFKIQNRVSVALSRAKEGFYIMGNMDLLCHNSEVWSKVRSTLEKQNAIGNYLTLRCQIHSEKIIPAINAEDFDKAREGGCIKICGAILNCEHACTKTCHILDRTHENAKCEVPCMKKLCSRGHVYYKMCYEDCGTQCMVFVKQTLQCGHTHSIRCHVDATHFRCITPVEATLSCGHVVDDKPCYLLTHEYQCPHPCSTRVEPCGHSCRKLCHVEEDPYHFEYACPKQCIKLRKDCSTQTHVCPNKCYQKCSPCDEVVVKVRQNCTHREKIECSKRLEDVPCFKPCNRTMPCGHHCKKQCFEKCEGCAVLVPKILPSCGHQVKTKCSEAPNSKLCNRACTLLLSCGHSCKNKCNEPCTNVCMVLVNHSNETDCGHTFKIPCNLLPKKLDSNSYELLKYCTQPCTSTLECSHSCSGTCGACFQGRIHETCQEKCKETLICGHECPIPCREPCQPCPAKCIFECKHSKCRKQCGEPCTPCREDCSRRCEHVKCEAKCGFICTVPPCTKPCNKTLKCSHSCVGFCGDPCPPLCRICNHDELTDIFLGYEDEAEARFVLMNECKHVIESKGMEEFFLSQLTADEDRGPEEVNNKRCPKCHTTLTSTQRYSDYIKQRNQDVVKIKEKLFGTPAEIATKKEVLGAKIQNIKLQSFLNISEFLDECQAILEVSRGNKRQSFNLILGTTLEAKIQIVESIFNNFESFKGDEILLTDIANYIYCLISILSKQLQRITNQEILDFERELLRLQRIGQLLELTDSSNFKCDRQHPQVVFSRDTIQGLLFKARKYDNTFDSIIKELLVEIIDLLITMDGS